MKTSAKKILGASLAASFLMTAAIPAFAQPGGHGGMEGGPGGFAPMAFSELDTNGDGAVTQEEMDARKAARFAEADTNGDGLLSVDEMLAAQAKQEEDRRARRAARMIERFDSNDDGQLSAEELSEREGGRRGSLFERADADNDGKISEEEFQTAMNKARKFREGGRFGKRHQ